MDWWFKFAMLVLLPIAAILFIALVVPLPKKKDRKWGPREY